MRHLAGLLCGLIVLSPVRASTMEIDWSYWGRVVANQGCEFAVQKAGKLLIEGVELATHLAGHFGCEWAVDKILRHEPPQALHTLPPCPPGSPGEGLSKETSALLGPYRCHPSNRPGDFRLSQESIGQLGWYPGQLGLDLGDNLLSVDAAKGDVVVFVANVTAGSQAATAGLIQGDVVLLINDNPPYSRLQAGQLIFDAKKSGAASANLLVSGPDGKFRDVRL
jgi:hypothetical protein